MIPADSIFELESGEYFGRRAGVRYSSSLVGVRAGFTTERFEDQFRELEPGDGLAASDVKDARLPAFHEVNGARREQRGVGGARKMVLDNPDGVAGPGEAQHQFEKIAAGGV